MSVKRRDGALVSIVIPTYNRAHLVTEALDSVWAQTHRPIECIVVDDGSTDDTVAVLTDWKRKHHDGSFFVRVLQQENRGAPAARNHGLESATGEYRLFLDSDDRLTEHALETLIRECEDQSAGAVYGNYIADWKAGETKLNRQSPVSESAVVSVVQGCPLTSTVLLRREAVGETRWREELPCAQEFGFFVDLALRGVSFRHVDKPVAYLLQHDGPGRINNRQTRADLTSAIGSYLLDVESEFRRLGKRENEMYDKALVHRAGLLASYGRHDFARQLMRRANRLRTLRALLREPNLRADILVPAFLGARLTGLAHRLRRILGSG